MDWLEKNDLNQSVEKSSAQKINSNNIQEIRMANNEWKISKEIKLLGIY